MRPIYEVPEEFERAVNKTAQSYISRFGKDADEKAWDAARHPGMTPAERAYCEAVANPVTVALRGTHAPTLSHI